MSEKEEEKAAVGTPAPTADDIGKQSLALAQIRPSRLSMEGYIFNANMVLECALSPDNKTVPVELFEKCVGVCVVTVVHVGAVVTLYYGTGLLLKKKPDGGGGGGGGGGGWSLPSSVSVGGTSFGAVLGGKRDNSLIFIMDEETMEDFCKRPQSRIGVDAALTAGNAGGDANLGMDQGTVTFSYTEGVYAGAGLQMATLETSSSQNEAFYGKKVKAKDILYVEGAVTLPDNSQVPDIYKKLEMLAMGETWTPGDEDLNRSRHFLQQAQSSSLRFKSGDISAS